MVGVVVKRSGKVRPLAAGFLVVLIACGSWVATLPEDEALGFVHQERFRRVPVVMVVFDEFPIATLMNRQREVDPELFPNFARIQQDSIWFRNATTPSAFSNRAVPSVLTGLYPRNQNGASKKRSSIFNLLGGSYDIRANEDLGSMCPSNACEDESTSAMDGLMKRYGHIFPANQGAKFLSFLSFIRQVNKSRFYFMHLVMPHQPWRYLPTGQVYPQTSPIPGEIESVGKGKEWADDQWLVNQAYQRHLLQTALLDRQMGVLIDRLKNKGIYGRSLLVVTADHGIAYAPGASKRVITKKTVGHISAVPLFVKPPFLSDGRISDRPVETVDIVPTMADILKLSNKPQDIDGISALTKNFPTNRHRVSQGIEIGPLGKAKFAVAKMKYEMFGEADSVLDLWKTGPGKTEKLVGRFVDELTVEPGGTTTVHIDEAEAHVNTEPDAPLLPALLEGTLNGASAEPKQHIAVAMNGRVVATTRTYTHSQLVRFYAMLPPQWFGQPPNELDLYLIKNAEDGTLEPLQQSDSVEGFLNG